MIYGANLQPSKLPLIFPGFLTTVEEPQRSVTPFVESPIAPAHIPVTDNPSISQQDPAPLPSHPPLPLKSCENTLSPLRIDGKRRASTV